MAPFPAQVTETDPELVVKDAAVSVMPVWYTPAFHPPDVADTSDPLIAVTVSGLLVMVSCNEVAVVVHVIVPLFAMSALTFR